MHFAKIPDEPVESMPVCYIKTDTTKTLGRESSNGASSEDNSSGNSEDERVQRLAKLQEPDDLWTEVRDIIKETEIKAIPMEKNAKKQNGYLGRPYK